MRGVLCWSSLQKWYYINPNLWYVNDDFHKAARSLVAAYLNAAWGINYPYETGELWEMWVAATGSGDFLSLHTLLDTANNAGYRDETDGPRCPISAGGW